ncbi:glutathione S-transferase [soil metagenome]
MLTLHHAPRSRSGRTMWLLEELGADYRTHYIGIRYGDGSGARDPANPHPDGKAPALTHDDALITEGMAIALYLTDLVPSAGLGPTVGEPQRGAYLAWLAWNTGELEPAVFGQMYGFAKDNPHAQAALDAATARIEAALAAGPYMMGERFTAVDAMVGATLAWGRSVLPESRALDAYLARIAARPAHQAAQAKDAQVKAAVAA